MNNIKYKLQRFFRNRYGADPLGLALVGTSLILSILASITRIGLFSIVSMIVMAYEIYRMFSKNYVKRRIENDHYMEYKTIVQRRWKVIRNSLRDRNNHGYISKMVIMAEMNTRESLCRQFLKRCSKMLLLEIKQVYLRHYLRHKESSDKSECSSGRMSENGMCQS